LTRDSSILSRGSGTVTNGPTFGSIVQKGKLALLLLPLALEKRIEQRLDPFSYHLEVNNADCKAILIFIYVLNYSDMIYNLKEISIIETLKMVNIQELQKSCRQRRRFCRRQR